jgi:diaminobutyrate acetyltransferase
MAAQTRLNDTEVAKPSTSYVIRAAVAADGANIWKLVGDCGVLDLNSCYAYLMFCRDFAATTLVAEDDSALLGFVTAYIPPTRPDVVFVWQIGASPAARGRGLGKSLLRALLGSPACDRVRFLEATITPSNMASERLFRSIADELRADFNCSPCFKSSDFSPRDSTPLSGESPQHEPENLVRIGPIGN